MTADPHDKRILVDLDGTLTVGAGRGPYDFAPLATGAESFLQELHAMFDEVVICTARADLGAVKDLFRRNGLAKYINDYTNVKLPAKMIVEDRAVVHLGNLKDTLEKIRGFRTHWEKSAADVGHSNASTQVNLPEEVAEKVRAMGNNVPDEYLTEDGREDKPHITVLYGIQDETPDKVRDAVKGFGTVRARLGATEIFTVEKKGFDVVKLAVVSEDLKRLRKAVEKASTFTTDFPTYIPHVTIAYVKLGSGRKFTGDRTLAGIDLTFDSLTFCSKSDEYTKIPLT